MHDDVIALLGSSQMTASSKKACLTPKDQRSRREIIQFLIKFASSRGVPLSDQTIEFLDRHDKGKWDIDSKVLSEHLWNKKRRTSARSLSRTC